MEPFKVKNPAEGSFLFVHLDSFVVGFLSFPSFLFLCFSLLFGRREGGNRKGDGNFF